jgi:hypothetical protein
MHRPIMAQHPPNTQLKVGPWAEEGRLLYHIRSSRGKLFWSGRWAEGEGSKLSL